MELSIPFWSSDQKTCFPKASPFGPMIPKWFPKKRKWNYFSPFPLSDQKTSFTKVTPFGSLIPKKFAETGIRIISPLSGRLIKKLVLQKLPHLVK